MRTFIVIAIAFTFFTLSVNMVHYISYSNPIYFFPTSLVEYPILSHALYLGIVVVGVYSFVNVAWEGEQVADKPSFEGWKNWKVLAQIITVFFVLFMIYATVAGYSISHNFQSGCFALGSCIVPSRTLTGFAFFMYLISAIANIFYQLIVVILMTLFGIMVGVLLPSFVVGIIAVSTRHPAEGVIERSLRQLRPDKEAEREIARVLRERDVREEQDFEKLLTRIWPWERWAKRIEYRRLVREARRLQEMVDSKQRVFAEESRLTGSFHEMERARRRASDQR